MPKRIIEKNIDDLIIKATIEIGAQEGVMKCSAQKIAKKCNITHAVVLRHFGGTRAVWDKAALSIDIPAMEFMKDLFEHKSSQTTIWESLLDYFINHPKETLYYNSYTSIVGFDPTENNERSDELLKYAKLFFYTKTNYSNLEYLMHWDFVTTMVLYYAEKIIRGDIANSPKIRILIRDIVFLGLSK